MSVKNNTLDTRYQSLLQDILDNGVEKKDRTGTGTISVFGRQIRHKMSEGFPLLTTKKMAWKTMVTELLWFLRGDTNIKYLVDNDCHIWDGDAYKNYEKRYYKEIFNYETASHNRLMSKDEFILNIKTDDEFANKWGELGPIYGKQWRRWNKVRFRDIQRVNQHPTQIMGVENPFEEEGKWVRGYEDQIANLINELKTNPDSRRLMVNAWNVGELDQMVLPPCHYGFQVYTRELSEKERMKLAGYEDVWGIGQNIIRETVDMDDTIPRRAISLMFNMRSTDVPLGLPFNLASYGLLLEIIAKEVNMMPDELIGNLGDTHIYLNQIEGIKEQLTREPFELPTLKHMKTNEFFKSLSEDLSLITHLDSSDFTLENYQSHPAIKLPLSN